MTLRKRTLAILRTARGRKKHPTYKRMQAADAIRWRRRCDPVAGATLMKVEHPFVPGIYPPTRMVLEVRECATLGTNFADVYMNDVLFARELPKPMAEKFVQYPRMYSEVFCDSAKMRAFVIEARERSDD